jgi:glycosyltransferase involved in cell wall biosynthesis
VLWYHARKTWQAAETFRAERLGILHFLHCYYPSYEIPLLAAWLARIPVRLSDVQTEPMQLPPKTRLRRAIARVAMRTATHVRAMSDDGAAMIAQRCGIPMRRIGIVTSHVTLARFASNGAARPDHAAAGRTVLMVARLTSEKGHRVLFDAVDALKDRHPDTRYWIAGEGPLRDELEREVAMRGLERWIQFLGFRRDVPELLQQADMVVLPSFHEELPWAVLEAMAAGRPVIATPVGAVAGIIEDGKTGRLVQPGNSVALASTLDALLSCDRRLLAEMGRAARRRIEERHAHPDLLADFDVFYRAASSNGARRP